MRTIRTKVYKFNELSKDAQQNAIDKNYDINVTYNEWWESVYYDAENAGLKITGFDIDRGSYCNGNFIESANFTANKIIENHGEICDTYKTAKQFIDEVKMIENSTPVIFDEGTEDEYEDYSEREDLIEDAENEFLQSILEDYRIILQKEYEYLTSTEAIKETIIANEYEFTKDGIMI